MIGGISVSLREQVQPDDLTVVRRITESSGFFQTAEIEVAVELVQAKLSQGAASGYHFLFADAEPPLAETIGYSCFGPIPCTLASYDLYWIAAHDRYRGIGLGKLLLTESEDIIRRMGGRRIYIETSSRSQYEPTRNFYTRQGYRQVALIPDFYAPGDGKIIYVKVLE
ncbi:MAG: GNAT family N-acetyltransferase [Spirochaetaceae bacterium]|nr:MAG: GNAT family N-acetyltransferase [Spirochaetaceae bacterium]